MWQNCVFVWVCENLLYVKFVSAKIWYVCVNLLYVKFVCVWVCVKFWYVCIGGRRRKAEEPGVQNQNKNTTSHKVAGKKLGETTLFQITMLFKDSHLWSLLDRYDRKKNLAQIDNFFSKTPFSSQTLILEISWIANQEENFCCSKYHVLIS